MVTLNQIIIFAILEPKEKNARNSLDDFTYLKNQDFFFFGWAFGDKLSTLGGGQCSLPTMAPCLIYLHKHCIQSDGVRL